MSSKKSELLDAFRQACRPPVSLKPSEWCSGRVALYEGLSPYFEADSVPWFIEPLNAFADIEAKEVCVLAPVGMGKTATILEAGQAYNIAEDGGPTLLVGSTDADLKDWSETRFDYTLRNTKETSFLLPTGKNRHKKRKDAIIFPHMAIFMTGANLSGLQAKSMRRVICDEPWTYAKGMLREAEGRLHDRWNRQFYLISQAGFEGDDWHKKCESTSMREFMFRCPSCDHEQPWRWGNVKYDESITDRVKMAQTAHLVCENPDCGHCVPDNAQKRREIASKARYVQIRDGMPNSIGFHCNALCNWRLPLWRLVIERCNAMDEVARGNLELLRQFIQKRLAEFWSDEQEDERVELTGHGYKVQDYANGEKWECEEYRFMTIDRQQDHFWTVIRAWASNGDSRLLYFDKVDTWERLQVIQKRYNVENKMTQIDCGYQKDEVYKRCAQYGWLALRGDKRESYPHKRRGGRVFYKPYSPYQDATSSDHRVTKVAYFSNLVHKDILFQLRNQRGVAWQVPDDIGSEYLRQIDAEVRRGEGKTAKWEPRIKDNHAVDCEDMQVVIASMLGLIGSPETEIEA